MAIWKGKTKQNNPPLPKEILVLLITRNEKLFLSIFLILHCVLSLLEWLVSMSNVGCLPESSFLFRLSDVTGIVALDHEAIFYCFS